MGEWQARDPEFEAKVRDSFARQAAMATIGARLGRVAAGEVEIELPFRGDLIRKSQRSRLSIDLDSSIWIEILSNT
jgi:hypothetical protein